MSQKSCLDTVGSRPGNDDLVRDRIFDTISRSHSCPLGLDVRVQDGIVDLGGIVLEEQGRRVAIAAAESVQGVVKVHDHLRRLEPLSGLSIASPEDREHATAGLAAQLPLFMLPFH